MVCSLEIPPAKMLSLIIQQKVGDEPTDKQVEEVAEWLDDRMVYHSGRSGRNPDKKPTWVELRDDMEYAYKRYGVSRYIIDSLHFLVHKEDYEAQDNLTVELQDFDLSHGVHTALVAHANIKGRRSDHIPGEHDVEGSGGMMKPIDNGITIWRNEFKQEQIEDPIEHGTTKEKAESLHDGVMKIWKQRENGAHATVKLWFDRQSRTFRARQYGKKHFFEGEENDENIEEQKGEF
jgi:hypothetical protein